MTRVIWLALTPGLGERGAWDMGIVEELTAGPEYQHLVNGRDDYDATEGAVVVFAGQHNLKYGDLIAAFVKALPWALTIITSDEEAAFPIDLLPNDAHHQTWTQYHARDGAARLIPIGVPPGTAETLATIEADHPARMGDVFFAGQNTHERREELLDVMKEMAAGYPQLGNLAWVATTGFRAGLDQERYLRGLRDARIAPCPSGYHSLDSFRLYEALAAGCIPIVEHNTPDGEERMFWRTMFGQGCPIPSVASWHELPDLVDTIQRIRPGAPQWIDLRDAIQEWWHKYRAGLTHDFRTTIALLQS